MSHYIIAKLTALQWWHSWFCM